MAAETFEDLKLPREILDAIYQILKFSRPSKIQAQALPYILNDPPRNLIAQAVNGSGKTVCFLLGCLMRVNLSDPSTQVLCVVTTRELALQTFDVLNKLIHFSKYTASLVVEKPLQPVTGQIIIGTSGSVAGGVSNRKINLKGLKLLVFDEADDMTANQYNCIIYIL